MPMKLKLTYFNAKGRAEPLRIVLEVAGKDYEDVRVSPEDWKELKEDKKAVPWGLLPVLSVDDRVIGESGAILRFLTKQFGLGGKDCMEFALIDGICEYITGIREKLYSIISEKCDKETKKKNIESFIEKLVPMLQRLESNLEKNAHGEGFFVGSKVSSADIMMFHLSELLESDKTIWDSLDENAFPKLWGLCQRVAALPKVEEWLRKRPQTAN